jgi:hypothetical protein
MSKQLTLVVAVCLVVVLLIAPAVTSQQVEKPVFTGPPAPEELKVLAPFVGQWQTEGTIRPSLRHKEGFTSKGETSSQWMHNGHFLRLEGFGVSTQGRFESTTIISFNRTIGQFRSFAFNTDGLASEAIGEWDARTNTLTTKGLNLPAGWTALGKMTIEKDRLVQSVLVKNEKGEVVRDVTSTSERKK